MGGSKAPEAPKATPREARVDDEEVETQTVAEEKKRSKRYGRSKANQILDVTSNKQKSTFGE